MHKREFLRTLGGSSLGLLLSPALLERFATATPTTLARDEEFWTELRARYALVPDYINLESGYFSMQSEPVLERFVGHVRRMNLEHSRYRRTRNRLDKARVQAKVAALAGCGPDELILTRNTTESMDTVISGIDWAPGDEAVMASCDYGAMLDHFAQMAKRYGMVNRVLDVPMHRLSDDAIVAHYAQSITPRTKLLMVCHIVNITGQVMPVARIAAVARDRGVPVMVDGAHAFAQLDVTIPSLGVDYYGASLHKWLGTPIGAGMLYVRKDRIRGLWPLFGESEFPEDDIRKLNHTGTHPSHTDLAIEDAIAFHEEIGVARKEARLRWLQHYWTSQVRGLPRIELYTPSEEGRTCAIATVGIQGMRPTELARRLFDEYRIWTVGIDRPAAHVQGTRVTPHLFTTTAELDALVRALRTLAA